LRKPALSVIFRTIKEGVPPPMAPRPPGPAVVRRRLGAELRKLRDQNNVRLEAVAKELGCSQSKISRLENGLTIPNAWDIRNLLTLYGVTDERIRNRMLSWAKDGRAAGWWAPYSDAIPGNLDFYISLEAEAASVASYTNPIFSGLLQTEDYARSILNRILPDIGPDATTELVQIRIGRQGIITRGDDPVSLHVVIDEAALRRVMGSLTIQRDQLLFLLERTELPNVTVQVFPFDGGAHPAAMSSFSIFTPRLDLDPVVVNIESTGHDAYDEQPARVSYFQKIFADLAALSLNEAKSSQLITELIQLLTDLIDQQTRTVT
jgi:transcriptional regulator with XRE-family HTH domain